MSGVLYTSTVRNIMYVIVCTHLNISHIISVVNKFKKWIFCYLRGTINAYLLYDRDKITRNNVDLNKRSN